MEGGRGLATGIPARLSASEGRRFGFTVGAAFLLLAAISTWRGHTTAPWVLGSLGAALGLGGLLIPGHLGPVYRGWMQLAHLLSKVTTPLVLGVVYFGVITPAGFFMRLSGRNPLVHPQAGGGYWERRTPRPDPKEGMRRQF